MSVRRTFWDKLQRDGDCLLWTGPVDKDGYGKTVHERRHIRAHRLAWTLLHGPIPDGVCVCHSCDVPACCNPEHMWLGTVAENNHDRHAKGRDAAGERNGMRTRPESRLCGSSHWSHVKPELRVRGERNGRARVTQADVDSIRAAHSAGVRARDLATKYGVSAATVWDICGGRTWKAVAA